MNDAAVPEEDTHNDNDMLNMTSHGLENVHTVQPVIDIAMVRKLRSDHVENV